MNKVRVKITFFRPMWKESAQWIHQALIVIMRHLSSLQLLSGVDSCSGSILSLQPCEYLCNEHANNLWVKVFLTYWELCPILQSPKLTLKDDADRPKPILAFSAVPSKQGTPRTTPNISRKSSPVHSSKGSLRTSEDTDTSPVPPTSPELSSSTTSSRTEIQSPVKSLPALEETVVMGDVLDDDDDDDFDESLRKEAFLRRRTSSVGDNIDLLNMPGFLVVTSENLL